MSARHPDGETLEQFLGGGLAEEASRALQRHLALCPACEARLIAMLPEPPIEAQDEYRGLIHRLLDDCRAEVSRRHRGLAAERAAAAALWRELEPEDPPRRRSRVSADARFQSWGFFELLVDRSTEAVLEDAREAEDLLRLALEVIEHLGGGAPVPGALESARARAWTHLGDALRVQEDFRRAEAAFETAEAHLSHGWLDPLDEALLLEFRARLRRAQRRFDEALESVEGALAIYREVNEPRLQGRALLVKGLTLQYKGDLDEAAGCFRTSLAIFEGLAEPRLTALSQHNLVGCLQDAGHSREAAALIPETRRRMERSGRRADLLRLRWTEAKVAASLGRAAEAEAAFLEVRRAFLADSYAFDAALISLDLAALYLRQGRVKETKSLAAEILPVFRSREVPRDALAAVIVFQRAADMEHLSLGLVEDIAARLRRARSDPEPRSRTP